MNVERAFINFHHLEYLLPLYENIIFVTLAEWTRPRLCRLPALHLMPLEFGISVTRNTCGEPGPRCDVLLPINHLTTSDHDTGDCSSATGAYTSVMFFFA